MNVMKFDKKLIKIIFLCSITFVLLSLTMIFLSFFFLKGIPLNIFINMLISKEYLYFFIFVFTFYLFLIFFIILILKEYLSKKSINKRDLK